MKSVSSFTGQSYGAELGDDIVRRALRDRTEDDTAPWSKSKITLPLVRRVGEITCLFRVEPTEWDGWDDAHSAILRRRTDTQKGFVDCARGQRKRRRLQHVREGIEDTFHRSGDRDDRFPANGQAELLRQFDTHPCRCQHGVDGVTWLYYEARRDSTEGEAKRGCGAQIQCVERDIVGIAAEPFGAAVNREAELGVEVYKGCVGLQTPIELTDEGSRIDEFPGVEPRDGAGDDIADAIMQLGGQEAGRRNAVNDLAEVFGPNSVQLKVCPRGDFNGAIGKATGQIGDCPELIRFDQTSRHPDSNE